PPRYYRDFAPGPCRSIKAPARLHDHLRHFGTLGIAAIPEVALAIWIVSGDPAATALGQSSNISTRLPAIFEASLSRTFDRTALRLRSEVAGKHFEPSFKNQERQFHESGRL